MSLLKTVCFGLSRFSQTCRIALPAYSRTGHVAVGANLQCQVPRNMTRSLWHMCRSNDKYSYPTQVKSIRCGCCGLHTQGDKDLVSFLNEEISLEKKSEKTPGKLPAVKGFSVLSSDGADVVLQKKEGNETVTIRLNVNGSVDDDAQIDESKNTEAQMVSKPPFVVEINKGGATTLALQCIFPHPDDAILETADGQQQYEDLLEVQELTILKGDKWEDKTYCVQGSILDGNLYDMLVTMLEERGINAEFIDTLIEFSTAYEHKRYIAFLEGLKDFAASQ